MDFRHFKSFGDAPDGMSEELKEVTYAVGAEYFIKIHLPCRWDIFMKVLKGARQFFSLGQDLVHYYQVDVSYLFSASKVRPTRKYITILLDI
jgi:hypothetical protein